LAFFVFRLKDASFSRESELRTFTVRQSGVCFRPMAVSVQFVPILGGFLAKMAD